MTEFNLKDNVETEAEAQFRLENKKWDNRRKMAWRSLNASIALVLLVMLIALSRPEALDALDPVTEIVVTSLIGLFSVVGMYFGATAWWDIASRKKPPAQ